ncbi:ATP-dependent DNA helicase MCM [Natronomonas pharaonis DSM 2160]|uniref:DNA helicase n=1 Tax=Natronomonas pharaonis (strain ATCC 35678 / DSM 2160 / CIP 103997 / JCM 8858 / NBRC 14720 / NCIMB 2260 / Gabara) TaxID=348780 RepID=A0A1U7EXX0_NATPD|nr:minichromosome maintenance protein MCM [Natronomonas pharaonis]CAI50035.1 ATP-dependent DNA helicase MCM [Natronomonas pharaonis DSM 2160]
MSIMQETIEELVQFFRDYYPDEIGQLAMRFPRDQKSLYVDFDDVYRFDPDLADDLREQPERMLEAFEEALSHYDLPVDVDIGGAHVRIYNLPTTLDVEQVSRHSNIGTLLDIRGQVQKVSAVKPRIQTAVFECQRCSTRTEIPQTGEQLQEPHECSGCERQGPFVLAEKSSDWVDHQYARIQQPPERTKGGEGETIDVHLEDDLIREFEAGDRITLTGMLDIETPDRNQSRAFDTTVDAQAVIREESDYEDIDVKTYRDEITAIASGEEGDPYELLIDSINPEHKGDEDIKLAIALQMFGGWSRGGRVRGDSHILLLGDPGCGKSTFLQAVDDLAPRSTYASGKGATAAGITAAAVADDFGESEWGLEAGALVLADGGIACLDEIDKVPKKAVSSMHDALESQRVRVNKAGINATLNSRTALLAAGNPSEGRFDPYQPRAQQIDLGPTLMSRFDLMFMVSDSPDVDSDREVVEHMIRSRRAAAKQELGEELTEKEQRSIEPAIPKRILRAYIAYAKNEVTPYLPQGNSEARDYLQQEFLKLRLANEDDESSPVPVTFRQEEAIERLAEASARVRLDDEVTKGDVDRALGLVRKSMEQVGIDPETGEFDADVVETSQSKSQRTRRKRVLAIIEDKQGTTVEEVAEIIDETEKRVRNDVQSLKNRGQVYELDGEVRPT